jgi:hypothetical protein
MDVFEYPSYRQNHWRPREDLPPTGLLRSVVVVVAVIVIVVVVVHVHVVVLEVHFCFGCREAI